MAFRLVAVIEGRHHRFSLERGEQILGSHPDCALRLAHSTVSRRHAKITVDDARVTIARRRSSPAPSSGSARFPWSWRRSPTTISRQRCSSPAPPTALHRGLRWPTGQPTPRGRESGSSRKSSPGCSIGWPTVRTSKRWRSWPERRSSTSCPVRRSPWPGSTRCWPTRSTSTGSWS